MNIELEAEHFDAFYGEMAHLDIAMHKRMDPTESIILLPGHLGEGYVKQIKLPNGMELGLCRMTLHQPLVMDVGIRYPHMELAFSTQGSGTWCERGRNQERSLASGTGSLIYMNDAVFHAEQFANEPIDHMELRIDFARFRHLLGELPWRLEDRFYCKQSSISPAVHHILEEIKSCPYGGSIKRLFLEGKSLELLALLLDDAEAGGEAAACAAFSWRKEDIRSLHLARDILSRSWREPPGLLQLARKVGLNDFKLKRGFKELFGTTVFGYVRQLRMQQARELLEQGGANVTEAAYLVGYSNISHFSALFRKTFGCHPREYVKHWRAVNE
ncbi:MAG: helix-turn-helix protein [Paenibacillaceae bacterium]|jgi:AraC-like DNA-binding protein|nr:helix-turn-helix protein [Paenibacillaceae bacterium]